MCHGITHCKLNTTRRSTLGCQCHIEGSPAHCGRPLNVHNAETNHALAVLNPRIECLGQIQNNLKFCRFNWQQKDFVAQAKTQKICHRAQIFFSMDAVFDCTLFEAFFHANLIGVIC